jgi:hypothetical protein
MVTIRLILKLILRHMDTEGMEKAALALAT